MYEALHGAEILGAQGLKPSLSGWGAEGPKYSHLYRI